MNAEQFTFWLQGFFELTDTRHLSESQVQIIKDHLNLVFNKVTPKRDIGGPSGAPMPVFPQPAIPPMPAIWPSQIPPRPMCGPTFAC